MAFKMKNPSIAKMVKMAGNNRTAMKMKAEEAAAMKMKKAAMKLKEEAAMKLKEGKGSKKVDMASPALNEVGGFPEYDGKGKGKAPKDLKSPAKLRKPEPKRKKDQPKEKSVDVARKKVGDTSRPKGSATKMKKDDSSMKLKDKAAERAEKRANRSNARKLKRAEKKNEFKSPAKMGYKSPKKMKKSAMKIGDPKKKEGRTRLDDKLEKDDKRKDVFNPTKADKLADKAADRKQKAKDAIEKVDQTGKGGNRASRLVRRAAEADDKARAEARKRGRDDNSSTREPKGVVRVKRAGGFTTSGRYKKQTGRVLRK